MCFGPWSDFSQNSEYLLIPLAVASASLPLTGSKLSLSPNVKFLLGKRHHLVLWCNG